MSALQHCFSKKSNQPVRTYLQFKCYSDALQSHPFKYLLSPRVNIMKRDKDPSYNNERRASKNVEKEEPLFGARMGKAPEIGFVRKIGNPQSLPIKALLKKHKIQLTKDMRIIEIGQMVIIKKDEPEIKIHFGNDSYQIPEDDEIELYDVSSEKEGVDKISSDEWKEMGGI